MKGTLPEKLLSDLIELTDTISKDSQNRESRNEYLVGEIDEEWYIDSLSLGNIKFESFLFDMIREYVKAIKFQNKPIGTELECSEEKFIEEHEFFKESSWKIESAWFNNQKDDEFNPIHFHEGILSGVLYLKIPEYLPARKRKNDFASGAIFFMGNQGASTGLFTSQSFAVSPKVGDIFLFPSSLKHMVYPFRTADGKGIRRSLSFNLGSKE